MTVKQLIERLQYFPDDMQVYMAQPVHDYWRTTQAAPIDRLDVRRATPYRDGLRLREPGDDHEPTDKRVIALL
jgi:hypothetical protein